MPKRITGLCGCFLGIVDYEPIVFETLAPDSPLIGSESDLLVTPRCSLHEQNESQNKLFTSRECGGWSSGVHSWHIRVLSKRGPTSIGVITADRHFWYCFDSQYGSSVSQIYESSEDGVLVNERAADAQIACVTRASYNVGDEVTVCLDCDVWKLRWSLNDEKIRELVKVEPDQTYYPFISSNNTGDSFKS